MSNKVKLDKETLKAIWDASRPTVEKNKKSKWLYINREQTGETVFEYMVA